LGHASNPSYSGARDLDDHGSMFVPGKYFKRPYLKKTHHKKRAGGVNQGVGSEFKSSTKKKEIFL
jgi:hypothetical protein